MTLPRKQVIMSVWKSRHVTHKDDDGDGIGREHENEKFWPEMNINESTTRMI